MSPRHSATRSGIARASCFAASFRPKTQRAAIATTQRAATTAIAINRFRTLAA